MKREVPEGEGEGDPGSEITIPALAARPWTQRLKLLQNFALSPTRCLGRFRHHFHDELLAIFSRMWSVPDPT